MNWVRYFHLDRSQAASIRDFYGLMSEELVSRGYSVLSRTRLEEIFDSHAADVYVSYFPNKDEYVTSIDRAHTEILRDMPPYVMITSLFNRRGFLFGLRGNTLNQLKEMMSADSE